MRSDNCPVILFVTVNSAHRKPILASPDVVRIVLDVWREATLWRVGRYVFMPDHIHLFAAPTETDVPVARWVAFWKSQASNRWPRPGEHPIWQKDCWDRQLRNAESYAERWQYVLDNPVRAGLVSQASDWPFSGELNVLDWREP
jgi:putative transposase